MIKALGGAATAMILLTSGASAVETYTVAPTLRADDKAVFATVESLDVIPARVRTGGTIVGLVVKEGDRVERGQVVARIGDQKLVLQQGALDAQINAATAQQAQAQGDLARSESLFKSGVATRAHLDELITAVKVATNALKARTAERDVLEQQLSEGQVLAPTAGRVLKVPVTIGTVVISGEAVATIAQEDFILRLQIAERYAHFLKTGDKVRLDGEDLAAGAEGFGTIARLYPQIENGRVVADAEVAGLGDYFVGERVRVWMSGDERRTFVVPSRFIVTRFGLDYALVQRSDGAEIEVPVQLGREQPRPGMPDALEIMSGLQPGDVLVQP